MNLRKVALGAALATAALFGITLFFFVQSTQHANAAAVVTVRVLVAARNIDKGLTVNPSMFTTELRDRRSVDPDAVTDARVLTGQQFSLIAMPAGAVLTQSKIGTPHDIGLSVRLKPGERAISINVDHAKDVSGLLLPGDRVDVLAQGPRVDNHTESAVTILRGILVLAVGQGLETTGATPSPDQTNASTVTLAVTPRQAAILMTADQNATIRLALRSPKERLAGESVQQVIYNGTGGSAARPEPPRAPSQAAPAAPPPAAPAAPPLAAPLTTAAAPAAPAARPAGRPAVAAPVAGSVNGVEVIEGSAAAPGSR